MVVINPHGALSSHRHQSYWYRLANPQHPSKPQHYEVANELWLVKHTVDSPSEGKIYRIFGV